MVTGINKIVEFKNELPPGNKLDFEAKIIGNYV